MNRTVSYSRVEAGKAMKTNQIKLFATKTDFERLLVAIEKRHTLQFVNCGFFDIPVQHGVNSLLNSELGIAAHKDRDDEAVYRVADLKTPIYVLNTSRGTAPGKYAIDESINPHSVAFRPGRMFKEFSLICGRVNAGSDNAICLNLFQLFKGEIRTQFKIRNSYYIGKEAVEMLEKSWRLMKRVNSPAPYDFHEN
jgi:hypothetical protein